MCLLQKAETGEVTALMHQANLLETYYDRWKVLDADIAQATLKRIYVSPITIVEPSTAAFLHEAARFKVVYGIPLGDCFLCATASIFQGTIVTADHNDLDCIEENEPIPFLWIRPKPEPKPDKTKADLNSIIAERDKAIQRAEQAERALAAANRHIARLEIRP
jgi:predicted nucleic acid-binding protein